MSTASQLYRAFIDGLVKRRPDVIANWVRTRHWRDPYGEDKFDAFFAQLTDEQIEMVAQIAQEARDGGIHDTLAYIQEKTDLEGLRLLQNGMDLTQEREVSLFY